MKKEKVIKKKSKVSGDRIHYDVFSKSRGYICTCMDENSVVKALQALYIENEKFWRRAKSEGKKFKAFDCYGVARQGDKCHRIDLTFAEESDEDEDMTYEEVIEESR